MEARQTEYRGVVFRSRSEAIVARSLDMEGLNWEYEREDLKLSDGWVPDFWVIMPSKKPRILSMFIEYKPANPTDTYLKELNLRFKELSMTKAKGLCLLMCGSPFDAMAERTLRAFKVSEAGDWMGTLRTCDWNNYIFRKWDEAKRHRFDLSEGEE